MLRISKLTCDHSRILLKLEGKLLEPWVEELECSLNGSSVDQAGITLDLSALTFADAPGIQVLANLIRQGATVAACSGYIAALLQMEKS